MFANIVLIILGKLGIPGLCEVVGAFGRIATPLNYPGTLCRSGLICLFYFSYLFCVRSRRRVYTGLATTACLALIFFDGSRTGMIAVAALAVTLAYIVLKERFSLAICAGCLIVLSIPVVCKHWELTEDSTLNRMAILIEDHGSLQDMGEMWDPARYQMIQHTLELIGERPILGNGLGAAALEFRVEEGSVNEVAHNGYLQIWADAGVIGVVGFVATVWGWIPLWRALHTTRPTLDINQRAHLLNALFLLAVFGFSLLLHPLSTEWSEWITFTVPYAILAHIAAPYTATPSRRLNYACQPSFVG